MVVDDRLAKMLEKQEEFNNLFIIPRTASERKKVDYVKECVLNIQEELSELLSSVGNWKQHRYEPTKPRPSGVLGECIDVLKYIFDIALTYGYNADDLFAEFMEKSLVVEQRYAWEKALQSFGRLDNVVGLDLDGVLVAYPESWLSFLNSHLDLLKPFVLEDFNFSGAPLPSVSREQYMSLKHSFRESGGESFDALPLPHASEFTTALKELGFKIVILSARPYRQYKRMMADTVMWLQKYSIVYDAILWDREKHIRIIEQLPSLRFMVEDHPQIALEVASLGYKVFLLDRPYNKDYVFPENVVRVSSLMEIINEVK